MGAREVDGAEPWRGLHAPFPRHEGLRERKKRLTRQHLSDTATGMFLERGFDAVRVSEIAQACGVSEKTVFNYFPTKESLLLDRWDDTFEQVSAGLAGPQVSPVEAVVRILRDDVNSLTDWFDSEVDPVRIAERTARFRDLIETTPSLRAHQHDMMDQLTELIAGILADRTGTHPDDPEPRIAASALLGLWHVQFRALRAHMDGRRPPSEALAAVNADVARAARVIDVGLAAWPPE